MPAGRIPPAIIHYMNQLRFALIVVLAASSTVFAQQKKRVVVDDILRAVSVSDPQISPDGRSIACVVSRPNAAEDRFDSEIVLVDVASGKQRTLTHDRKGLGSPRWSPSGDRLAFLANASKAQIFIMPMQGGDAVNITSSPTGVQHFAWRPDGNAFAYAASDEKSERKDRAKFEDAFEV